MQTIAALTSSQAVALARFIEGHQRIRGSMCWRTAFCECTRRGHFFPYVTADLAEPLRQLVEHAGPLVVCYLRTAEVLRTVSDAAECPASGARRDAGGTWMRVSS